MVSGLLVGRNAECRGAFGHGVGVRTCRGDDLVELEVNGAEPGAHDVPVDLLADEGQPQQVHQGALQGGTDHLTRGVGQGALHHSHDALLLVVSRLLVSRLVPAGLMPSGLRFSGLKFSGLVG